MVTACVAFTAIKGSQNANARLFHRNFDQYSQ
jgi:hypothetical protein